MKARLGVSCAALVAACVFFAPQGAILPVHALQRAHDPVEARLIDSRVLQTWSTPELVKGEPSTADCRNPILVTDVDTGKAHLVWEEEGIIHYAFRDGGGWHVDPDLALVGDSPVLALDDDGYPHIVYASVAVSDGQLQIMHCARNASGWGPPQIVSNTQGPSTDPDIALIINGNIQIVWAGNLEGKSQIYHARSMDLGQTWFSVQPIIGAQGLAPTLAIAPDGQVWAAWQSLASGSTPAAIYAAVWDGENWSDPVNLSQGAGGEARGPDIGCDSDGLTHLVWEAESEEGDLSVYYIAGRTSAWGAQQRISGASDETATQPYLAIGPDDMIYVVWDAGYGLNLRQASHGNWGSIECIAVNQAGIRQVSIAAARGGALQAVWSARNSAGVWDLVYSQRAADETSTPTATSTATMTPEGTIPPPPPGTSPPTPSPAAPPTAPPTVPPSATQTFTPHPSLTPSHTATPVPTATTPASVTPTPTPDIIKTSTLWRAVVYVPMLQKPSLPNSFEAPDQAEPTPIPSAHPDGARTTASSWVWSPVDNVSQSSADSHAASMVVTQDGDAYSVWEEPLASAGAILYYSLRSGGDWSAPTSFFVGEEPDLGVSSDGVVRLVYANEFAGQYDIFYTTWTGDGWATPENVSNTSGTSSQPALAVKPDDGLILVWTDTTEGYNRIYYGWKDNGVWNTYFVPASSGGSAPDVAVGKNSRVWVTWQVLEEPDQYDIYAIYGDGISWSPYAMNLSSSSGDSVVASLAGVTSWGAFVAWQENSGSGEVYYADTLQYSDWWSEPINLSQSSPQSERPAIVANSAHDLHIAWDEGAQLLYRYRSPEGGWSPKSAIATGSAAIGEVDLALGVGRAICAQWSQPIMTQARDIYWRSGAFDMPRSLHLPLVCKQ